MVRGRRMKALIADTYANDGDCCSPKRKIASLRQRRRPSAAVQPDHCITEYFAIRCLQPVQRNRNGDAFTSKIPLDIGPDIDMKANFPEDQLSLIKDEYLALGAEENFDKVFITSSPHRIELCSPFENAAGDERPSKTEPSTKANAKAKLEEKPSGGDHKLTEYFPVRRSARKTKQTILEERQRQIEKCLQNDIEEGLEVHNFEGKGRGVVATKPFMQGDFVVEYSGDLLDVAEARAREKLYSQDITTGCYMYYFKYQNQQYCVDATAESGRLGRLVNHSRNGNLITRTVVVDKKPRLVLIAKENINVGEEICYDYGDRSKQSLKYHPWLAL